MNVKVGNIVEFFSEYRDLLGRGQVVKIFEKSGPFDEDQILLKVQGVTANAVWVSHSEIKSIISEG